MEYLNLIKNWHTKASDEDYFSKFVFEYLAFIAYLRKQKYPNSSNDRVALQKLKKDDDLRKKYLKSLSSVERQSWEILIDEFKRVRLGNASGLNETEEVKWWNHICPANRFCGRDGCHLPNSCQKFDEIKKGVIYDLEDWPNMIEFWRVIRDNMFHGAKDPENNRDKLVVEHGYKTLKPLVDIFLNESQQK